MANIINFIFLNMENIETTWKENRHSEWKIHVGHIAGQERCGRHFWNNTKLFVILLWD